jgi:hypothetical protein
MFQQQKVSAIKMLGLSKDVGKLFLSETYQTIPLKISIFVGPKCRFLPLFALRQNVNQKDIGFYTQKY